MMKCKQDIEEKFIEFFWGGESGRNLTTIEPVSLALNSAI